MSNPAPYLVQTGRFVNVVTSAVRQGARGGPKRPLGNGPKSLKNAAGMQVSEHTFHHFLRCLLNLRREP